MTKLPSSPVVAWVVANELPTIRSASTVAPATGPLGPRTVPPMVALPPAMATDVLVTAPATGCSTTPDRLAAMVVGTGTVVSSAGGVGIDNWVTSLQPAGTTTRIRGGAASAPPRPPPRPGFTARAGARPRGRPTRRGR